jgi:hypothetical protein
LCVQNISLQPFPGFQIPWVHPSIYLPIFLSFS